MKAKAELLPRLVASSVGALLALVATYAILRAWAVLATTEPDPALVIAPAHVPMFWRLGIATYAAGLTAIAIFFVSGRDASRTLRVVLAAIAPVAVLAAVQGLLLP